MHDHSTSDRRRLLLIINPKSGTTGKNGIEEAASGRLSPHGIDVEPVWTTGAGHATQLARQAVEQHYDGVIVAGGDGTVNETARGLCDTDVPMAIIPCGSGNGLARHLGVPLDVESALDIILDDNIVAADYGSVNGLPFFCTFGVGFDAAVSKRFARMQRRGRMSYLRSAIQEFLSYAPSDYVITLPDSTVITEKAFLVAVCNASQYGNNAYIAPRASILDGLLDITLIHSGSPLTTALVGIDLMTGFIDHNMLIDTLRVKELTISCPRSVPFHLDGEPVGATDLWQVRCHHQGLKLFAPSKETQFKPIITPVQSFINDVHSDLRKILKR